MANAFQILNQITEEGSTYPPNTDVRIALTSPEAAFNYAQDVIEGRWHEGESLIATSPQYAYEYALDIIGDRWPEAEPVILTRPKTAYWYTRNVVGERWPEAEAVIRRDPIWWGHYMNWVITHDL